ncbi:MAG: hypothetical protein CME67_05315 [Halobacteriovoraceae bacterium]|nr:hypothetical protein [Peredibacter sp.]MBJ00631.1 hypothetical protein [Halobacteriovoraceae bacterium]|tara:strand:+ start:775 stop:1317 length:543 start_codon:yes stop_codon:yes gene_type:complete
MSGEDKSKSKNFKGKGRRPRRGPRKPGAKTKQGPKKEGSSANKSRRPKSLTPARILQKYDNLLEQHIVARRKFYEMHGRAQGRQLEKIENNFRSTLEAIRRFETNLKDWQIEVLKEKIDRYPADRQFSSTHGLEPKGEEVAFSGEFEDPHLLPTQIEADFSNDTEESTGTIEDYKKYKGL